MATSKLPKRLIIVAGTYDGVLAGWDTVTHNRDKNDEGSLGDQNDGEYLKMSFAMAAHEGSVRCLSISSLAEHSQSSSAEKQVERIPGTLMSAGFDESIQVFSLNTHRAAGELKTPSDLGSPTCSCFAPPLSTAPTHALVGLTSGKIVLYKKRDWSVQHVLAGHDSVGGVTCVAVHPSGRMALSGGRDGKLILWDLTRGRLAFVYKLPKLSKKALVKSAINCIVWSEDGNRYAFCYDKRVTARDMATGEDLLDIDLPGRPNDLAFCGPGPEGLFLAAACDDGSLPLLGVGDLNDDPSEGVRRAVMAIEPVEGLVAGDARFKCIRHVEGGSGFLVVTANSGGTISIMDLEGAAQMMFRDDNEREASDQKDESDDDTASDSDQEEEQAVEILESVRVGSGGARITTIGVWSMAEEDSGDVEEEEESIDAVDVPDEAEEEEVDEIQKEKEDPRKRKYDNNFRKEIEMDSAAVEKARELIIQAKKRQKRKDKKTKKKAATK
jgi:protein MAK11